MVILLIDKVFTKKILLHGVGAGGTSFMRLSLKVKNIHFLPFLVVANFAIRDEEAV